MTRIRFRDASGRSNRKLRESNWLFLPLSWQCQEPGWAFLLSLLPDNTHIGCFLLYRSPDMT